MRLENLQQAVSLSQDLATAQAAITNATDALGVTLRGTYQGEDLVEFVRPHVLQFLSARRDAVLTALAAIGVDIGDTSSEQA